jgi:hypothetical protein
VTFVPSVYVWPHVRVNCDAPWPLAVIYPPADVRADARAAAVPPSLLRALRALGEPTRLQLLRVIAERPRSTVAPEALARVATERRVHAGGLGGSHL